jgi:glycosyltransferase involved in cell wall biosynthesis
MEHHYLMEHLADHCPVVWMNPARGWKQSLGRSSDREELPVHPNLIVLDAGPLFLQIGRPAALARLAFQLRVRRAMRLLRLRGCDHLIAYLWRPRFLSALRPGRFASAVYHISDEYSFSDVEIPTDPQELRTIAAVDQIFVHSPGLFEKKGGINPRTAVIPNGVEYERFAAPVPEPRDLAGIPRPRIGYTGWLKRQLDWPLLEALALSQPDWSFVFAGGQSPHEELAAILQRLQRLPNVYFLGAKPSTELARYPQHFDVCIMPYRSTDYTRYIYPLKLHEYLAGGRPVVGARIRSLELFSDLIGLADGPVTWVNALRSALSADEQSAERTRARQAQARAHDWAVLAQRVAETIGLPCPAEPRSVSQESLLLPVSAGGSTAS